MRIAMIGQEIPTLLPALLTDLLFAGRERDAEIRVEETNPAMAELLQAYGQAVFTKAGLGGRLIACGSREQVLKDASCVLYAGDPQAASRFAMDRSALSGEQKDNEETDEDPGLTDQARVNGGLGGLMHALRAGKAVQALCGAMEASCPGAPVINLGQPVARTTAMFLNRGIPCWGMSRSPLKGVNGLESVLRLMKMDPEQATAEIAGLPGFAFLLALQEGKKDVLPKLKRAVQSGEMGRLSSRWLSWWDAVAVGDVTEHAEFLPAQPDYIPEERPVFGETVERRKERILWMHTVAEQGADNREGAMAQLLLLSKAPPVRPMRLALALLRGEDVEIPAVTRRNGRLLPQLSPEAIIEAPLTLRNGAETPREIRLPAALAEIMNEIDEANRLAARAAEGDRTALRELVETDPALGGLDRLYCQELVEALIRLHSDAVSPALCDNESGDR